MLFLLDSLVPFMHLISSTYNYMSICTTITLTSICTSLKMEQYSQYLMSVKTNKNILACSSHYSWEEQAFAEDARGPLGGFVWPPRSYTCSFCRREFRSAQALGGHMNVHRREKAKFKQSVNGTTLTNPSRVCSILALGQESVDSSCDTKSCVYDGINRVVEPSLVLGFDLESCSNTGGDGGGGVKKRKRNSVTPSIMGGLDLELRLASFHAC